ncbi:nitroreductase family protein [Paenibacillus sinopodophylli]|uniref:nitroreductase family protein n=1 Tax=Paenibacillus sinopodophylli TaxID=1837342 RepID=UPI00110C9D51|nr:nitroreductase [Paenibacillus sinopodophylli]
MSVATIVKERRSIRKFKDQDVPDRLIYELLEQAGNLCDRQILQAMRIIVANQRESKDRLSRYMTNAFARTTMGRFMPNPIIETFYKRFAEVPGHLAVIVEDHESAEQKDEQYAQACFFLQSLQLLAWEKGLGMYWRSDEILYTPALFEKLGLTDGERLVGIIHFGFIAKTPRPRNRTSAAKKSHYWPNI